MKRLTGKVAWVTGAGSGMGEAERSRLARKAQPMLTGRRKEPLEAVAARIAKERRTARVHPGDMSAPRTRRGLRKRSKRNSAGSTFS